MFRSVVACVFSIVAVFRICSSDVPVSCHPEWQLVFVAVGGNGEEVWNRWTEKLPDGCCEINNGCLPKGAVLAFTAAPKKHLKSQLVDKWNTLKIKQVKVELYKDGLRRVFLVFNGKGSNFKSWFSNTRLLTDSWDDLYKGQKFNIFSIDGYGNSRRFHINEVYNGCPNDVGWMVVVDNYKTKCPWDKHNKYPAILYSEHQKITWNKLNFKKADFMAIWIQTE